MKDKEIRKDRFYYSYSEALAYAGESKNKKNLIFVSYGKQKELFLESIVSKERVFLGDLLIEYLYDRPQHLEYISVTLESRRICFTKGEPVGGNFISKKDNPKRYNELEEIYNNCLESSKKLKNHKFRIKG